MAESSQHKERVGAMVVWMEQQGATVTHAAGGSSLPDPYSIERHEPDVLATKDGVTWVGEAKIGTDLGATTSQEQFADFSMLQMSESKRACSFVLCVPKGYESDARRAVIDSGGSTANLTVIA